MLRILISHGLAFIGAAVGALLGHLLFLWIVGQGFYGLMIPGALLGFGCSQLAQERSVPRGVACGFAAALLGLYSEWKVFPFQADGAFRYFIAHVADLKPITLLMIGLGAAFGFWLGKDASPWLGRAWPPRSAHRP